MNERDDTRSLASPMRSREGTALVVWIATLILGGIALFVWHPISDLRQQHKDSALNRDSVEAIVIEDASTVAETELPPRRRSVRSSSDEADGIDGFASIGDSIHLAPDAYDHIELAVPVKASVTSPSLESFVKLRKHIVRLEIEFDGLGTRTAEALVIDRFDSDWERPDLESWLIIPRSALTMSASVNGGLVSRTMSRFRPVGLGETALTGNFVYSSDSDPFVVLAIPNVVKPLPESGFSDSSVLGLGTFLYTVSVEPNILPQSLEVVGPPAASLLEPTQVIELSNWRGSPGTVLMDQEGRVAAIMTRPASGDEGHSFAIPISAFFDERKKAKLRSASVHKHVSDDVERGSGASSIDFATSEPDPSPKPSDPEKPKSFEAETIRIYTKSNLTFHLTIERLFGDVAKVTFDNASQSLIIRAPSEVQEKIAETYEVLVEEAKKVTQDQKMRRDQVADDQESRRESEPKARSREEVQSKTMVAAHDEQDVLLDHKARDVARRIRAASPNEQPALRTELEQITERHFQLRQDHRKQDIDELNQRLEKLRVSHTRRQQNKAEVIKRRLRELLDPSADLDWEKPSETSIPDVDPVVAGQVFERPVQKKDQPETSLLNSNVDSEPTYDSIPYSQWLKILGTDRQPNRLIAAMGACSRLAQPQDERSIIRKIFLAAALFEKPAIEDIPGQTSVWQAASSALSRLPVDLVVEELLIALRDQESFKKGRQFQGQFIARDAFEPIRKALVARCDDVIPPLVQIASQDEKESRWIIAAACMVWQRSKRPLNDFGNLPALIDRVIDDKWNGDWFDIQGERVIVPEWKLVVDCVIRGAPDTPNLAMRLVNSVHFGREVVELIGGLGERAEPAVPALVDHFLDEWKIYEDQIRAGQRGEPKEINVRVNNKGQSGTGKVASTKARHNDKLIVQLIKTLGDIGVGEKGYRLLWQLYITMANPCASDQFDREILSTVEMALSGFRPVPAMETSPVLLGDVSLLRGRWKLRQLLPGTSPKDSILPVGFHGRRLWIIGPDMGDRPIRPVPTGTFLDNFWNGVYAEIDDRVIPKRIEFDIENESDTVRWRGVFEVTLTTLRIQVAPQSESTLKALFVETLDLLPQGHVLMQFDREFPKLPESQHDPASSPVISHTDSVASGFGAFSATVNKTDRPKENPSPEKTFDGIPYSQWLKLLETERKPDRLAAAMEACGRLHQAKDAKQIAHGILVGAEVYEGQNPRESLIVWQAGWTALNRLPADVVVEELLTAMRDADSYKNGREFQGRYIADTLQTFFTTLTTKRESGSTWLSRHPRSERSVVRERNSEAMREAFVAHRDELIAQLAKVAKGETHRSTRWIVLAACALWRETKRPLNDFENLESVVLNVIDNNFEMRFEGLTDHVEIDPDWKAIAEIVAEAGPQTPDLAVKLMAHASESSEVVELIGKMGVHAEPVVPKIVDLFVVHWKKVEDEIRKKSDKRADNSQKICIQCLKTLGKIGVGAKGYSLLRQVNLVTNSIQHWSVGATIEASREAEEALKKFKTDPDIALESILVSDWRLLQGRWNLRKLEPGRSLPQDYAQIIEHTIHWGNDANENKSTSTFRNAIGLAGHLLTYDVDETRTPKQINFAELNDKTVRRAGIYEATLLSLRIQVAHKGQPAPEKIVTNREDLPEGHVLMEFDRIYSQDVLRP